MRYFALIVVLTISTNGLAQPPRPVDNSASSDVVESRPSSPTSESELLNVTENQKELLVGDWTYRSFHSDPDLSVAADKLAFGTWTLSIASVSNRRLTGKMAASGFALDVTGEILDENPTSIKFVANGKIQNEDWNYEGLGYLVSNWPQAKAQRPAIVGTVIRSSVHSNGLAKAGYVAQWIAVKQDEKEKQSLTINKQSRENPPENLRKHEWELTDAKGNRVNAKTFQNKNSVLVFSQGFTCLHCADQIRNLIENAGEFNNRSVTVAIFVADSNESVAAVVSQEQLPFQFVPDPNQLAFKCFSCEGQNPRHGLFLIDQAGDCRWMQSGTEPYMDMKTVLVELDRIIK